MICHEPTGNHGLTLTQKIRQLLFKPGGNYSLYDSGMRAVIYPNLFGTLLMGSQRFISHRTRSAALGLGLPLESAEVAYELRVKWPRGRGRCRMRNQRDQNLQSGVDKAAARSQSAMLLGHHRDPPFLASRGVKGLPK